MITELNKNLEYLFCRPIPKNLRVLERGKKKVKRCANTKITGIRIYVTMNFSSVRKDVYIDFIMREPYQKVSQ